MNTQLGQPNSEESNNGTIAFDIGTIVSFINRDVDSYIMKLPHAKNNGMEPILVRELNYKINCLRQYDSTMLKNILSYNNHEILCKIVSGNCISAFDELLALYRKVQPDEGNPLFISGLQCLQRNEETEEKEDGAIALPAGCAMRDALEQGNNEIPNKIFTEIVNMDISSVRLRNLLDENGCAYLIAVCNYGNSEMLEKFLSLFTLADPTGELLKGKIVSLDANKDYSDSGNDRFLSLLSHACVHKFSEIARLLLMLYHSFDRDGKRFLSERLSANSHDALEGLFYEDEEGAAGENSECFIQLKNHIVASYILVDPSKPLLREMLTAGRHELLSSIYQKSNNRFLKEHIIALYHESGVTKEQIKAAFAMILGHIFEKKLLNTDYRGAGSVQRNMDSIVDIINGFALEPHFALEPQDRADLLRSMLDIVYPEGKQLTQYQPVVQARLLLLYHHYDLLEHLLEHDSNYLSRLDRKALEKIVDLLVSNCTTYPAQQLRFHIGITSRSQLSASAQLGNNSRRTNFFNASTPADANIPEGSGLLEQIKSLLKQRDINSLRGFLDQIDNNRPNGDNTKRPCRR